MGEELTSKQKQKGIIITMICFWIIIISFIITINLLANYQILDFCYVSGGNLSGDPTLITRPCPY